VGEWNTRIEPTPGKDHFSSLRRWDDHIPMLLLPQVRKIALIAALAVFAVGSLVRCGAANDASQSSRDAPPPEWSDGGPATHTIIPPEEAKTHTATFRRVGR
jgi:hypothetical protein